MKREVKNQRTETRCRCNGDVAGAGVIRMGCLLDEGLASLLLNRLRSGDRSFLLHYRTSLSALSSSSAFLLPQPTPIQKCSHSTPTSSLSLPHGFLPLSSLPLARAAFSFSDFSPSPCPHSPLSAFDFSFSIFFCSRSASYSQALERAFTSLPPPSS